MALTCRWWRPPGRRGTPQCGRRLWPSASDQFGRRPAVYTSGQLRVGW